MDSIAAWRAKQALNAKHDWNIRFHDCVGIHVYLYIVMLKETEL